MDRPQPPTPENLTKAEQYARLEIEARAVLAGERDAVANLANCAALLFEMLPRLNWAGFYLLKKGELVLGPFQGRVACVRIALGRGVCGAAAQRRASILVADVHGFAGHIACDPASRSEIVVPLISNEAVLGVLDLDSPDPARFDDEDRTGLESIARLLIEGCDWPEAGSEENR